MREYLGQIGFVSSCLGILALFIVGIPPNGTLLSTLRFFGYCLAPMTAVGLVTSILALTMKKDAFAFSGMLLGILGMLYLPTVFLFLFV